MRRLAFPIVIRFLVMVVVCGVGYALSCAGEPQDIKARSERTVTLQAVDVPLNEVLSILAKNIPMEIRGTVPSQDRITVNFSHLSLEEALSRIMKGYNYVLMRADESAKPLLVVMNKISRTIQTEPVSVVPGATGPAPGAGAMAPQAGPARPGIQQIHPGQGREASSPVGGPAGMGQPVPQRPEPQPVFPGSVPATGPNPPLPGVPMGPGALPPGTAAGPGVSSSIAGGAPPVPFTPPGTMNAPPQGAAAGTPQPAPSAQPQQPAQPNPGPARIMTPFGDRSAD
jgi:hypothetical protein